MAPVLRQKLEETAEATADIRASYASLRGKADGPGLASEDKEALGSCSFPEIGRGGAFLKVPSIEADTPDELELFGVLEEVGPNRRFLASPSGSKVFHSAIDSVKPHFSSVLGKVGGSCWLSEAVPSLRVIRKHHRPRRAVST